MIKQNQVLFIAATVLGVCLAAQAADKKKKELPFTPGGEYRQHDLNRPKPTVKDPGPPSATEFAKPPPGAIVLFDGKDFSQWDRKPGPKDTDKSPEPKWKIENGYMEIVPYSGWLVTKQSFGDCQIHLEWATPTEIKENMKGQGRGNSGVYLPGHNEVQVLDSYQNETYADGQAAAVYGMYPPLFNVCRKPGEWQSYDITLEQPRFDADKKLVRPCRLTIIHNGVLVQDHVDLGGGATEGQLSLQDHHNPVRYRNIWIRPLKPDEIK